MTPSKQSAEERVEHTPGFNAEMQKQEAAMPIADKLPKNLPPIRHNDTNVPWQVGIFKDDSGVRHLAIWPESIPFGTIANPACLISPEATADKLDEANAELICRAVNSHEALVSALRGLIEFIEKNPQKQAALSFPYQQARAALEAATEGDHA